MAINPDHRNGWQESGPSPDPHHQSSEPSAKPATNGHAQIGGVFGLYAPLLLRNGYSPDPIEPGAKRPLGAIGDWNRFRTTPLTSDEIAAIATQHPNAGLRVVGGYGGPLALDIDTHKMDNRLAIDTLLGGGAVAKRGPGRAPGGGRRPPGPT